MSERPTEKKRCIFRKRLRGARFAFVAVLLAELVLRIGGWSPPAPGSLTARVSLGEGSVMGVHPRTLWDNKPNVQYADLVKPHSSNPKRQAYLDRRATAFEAEKQDRISNNLGMHRQTDCTAHKPADTFRVLCIGSSTTWGQTAHTHWPALLEKELATRLAPTRVEVLNAGVGTFSSLQLLKKFRHTLAEVEADVVIFMNAWNDTAVGWGSDADALAGKTPSLLERVRVVAWLRHGLGRLRGDVPPPRVMLAHYKENLRGIFEIAKSRGMRMLLCTEPSALAILSDEAAHKWARGGHTVERQTVYNNVAREVAKELDVLLVDVAAKMPEEKMGTFFFEPERDPIHPAIPGNTWIATHVLQALMQSDVVRAVQAP